MAVMTQEERIAAEQRVREQLGLPMMGANPNGSASAETLQVEREILGAMAYAFGEIWGRPGLPLRERCFITLAVLTAKYQLGPLADYVRASLRVGLAPAEILEMQEAVGRIYVDPLIKQYVVALVTATREHESVYLGASPRGSLALMRATQAHAMLDGRDFVQPDDVKLLAYPTLGHRVIVSPSARVRDIDAAQIVDEALPQPRELRLQLARRGPAHPAPCSVAARRISCASLCARYSSMVRLRSSEARPPSSWTKPTVAT